MLKQQLKDDWLRLTDRNSKYFFSLLRSKANKASISRLLCEDGSWASSGDAIIQEVSQFYSQLLGSRRGSSEQIEENYRKMGEIVLGGPVVIADALQAFEGLEIGVGRGRVFPGEARGSNLKDENPKLEDAIGIEDRMQKDEVPSKEELEVWTLRDPLDGDEVVNAGIGGGKGEGDVPERISQSDKSYL
ncbi:hypothetical protein Dimus_004924 [Dionaea muscipula]